MTPPPINILEREFLIWLRQSAEGMAAGNLNPSWARAYLALADAADRLDAMHARTTAFLTTNDGIPPEPSLPAPNYEFTRPV